MHAECYGLAACNAAHRVCGHALVARSIAFSALATWLYGVKHQQYLDRNVHRCKQSMGRRPYDDRARLNLGDGVPVVVGFARALLLLRPLMPREQLAAGLVGLASGFLGATSCTQIVALASVGDLVSTLRARILLQLQLASRHGCYFREPRGICSGETS